MKTFKQDYSLKKNKEAGAGFSDFATAYYGFDMPPVSECLKISQEFVEMVYQNAKADTITFVHGPNDVHSIYLGKMLLAKIRGEKLVQLWMPGLKKQDKTTNFLKGMGTQYLTFAGFPDLVHGGNKFLREARDLKCLYVPKMQDAGIETLYCSQLERVDLPAVTELGQDSLHDNTECIMFSAPNVRKFGKRVFYSNMQLNLYDDNINAPNLTEIGFDCADVFYELCGINKSRQQNRSR